MLELIIKDTYLSKNKNRGSLNIDFSQQQLTIENNRDDYSIWVAGNGSDLDYILGVFFYNFCSRLNEIYNASKMKFKFSNIFEIKVL